MRILCISATVVAAAFFAIAPRAYSQYMSMFNAANMAAVNIAGTVSVNSAIGKSANIASRSRQETENIDSSWIAPTTNVNHPYQPIAYTLNPAVRADVIETYMDRARAIDETEGESLAKVFRERDLFAESAQNFRAYGLDINDLGDVVTAYWAVNWGAVHRTGRPSVAQVQGLRTQFRQVLAGNQLTERTTAEERQQIADDMMMRLILIDGAVEQGLREGNTAQLQSVSEYVQQSSLTTMGVDLAALNLTAEGLTFR
ncbi:MAG: DUF6683 family protein [Phormidesmis sp.]